MDRERMHRTPPSSPRHHAGRTGVILVLALLVGPMLAAAWWAPFAVSQDDAALWTLDLADLNAPFSEAGGFTAIAVSADGGVVVVGLDNGGVLFLNATTGEELDAAQTADHGAVLRVTLTEDGSRAALVYEDGYLAVVDRGQATPLLTINAEPGGIPEEVRSRVAAQVTRDGRFLMVTDDQVYLFVAEQDNGTTRYRQVGLSAEDVGPFIYLHPRLPFFGALSAEGEVAIYSYGTSSLELVGSQTLEMASGESITAFGSSDDGARFGIALSSGVFRRYMPQLGPSGGQLRLDFEDQILGRPSGFRLSEDGLRLVVWSARETLWTEGRNRNVPDDEATAADAATVRVKPPTFDQRFASVETSHDLLRLLARFAGTDAETRLYNMPERDFFVVAEESASAAGPSAVDDAGREVYRTAGTTLQTYRITEKQLPPPGLDEVDRTGGGPTGNGNGDGDDVFGLPLSQTTMLLAGGGLLLLILLAVLVPLLLGARRGGADRMLPPLAAEPGGLPPLSTGAGTVAAPPSLKRVVPSAPMAVAPPEGLLVVQDVSVQGTVALHGLTIAWRRPAVVTMQGRAEDLQSLTRGLSGQAPVTGLLAVGGASAAETPMLFSRRIQVGLAPTPAPGATPEAAYHAHAATHRLPASLAERRIHADLAWLGPKRTAPVERLTPLDHWKLRLALAVIHRPHVVLLPVGQLPDAVARDTRVADAVGAVLRGVSRHFEVLVVLLDDGRVPGAPVHAWSDEAVRLTPTGFQDRTRLEGGQPVGEGGAGRPRRRRARDA